MFYELGEHLFKQIKHQAQKNQISLKKALNEYAVNHFNSKDVRNKVQTFIGNLANLINLKNFFRFDQLSKEIINNIQSLQASNLSKVYRHIEEIAF